MAKTSKSKKKMVRITLIKSSIGYSKRQKDTIRALGLRRMHQTVEHIDSPVIRGMVSKVSHLVQVDE
ncbi:MAG: 50S ribosomal protein L30 [Anaerolineales bacterium]|jgi:large subunit ribosomal protein L30